MTAYCAEVVLRRLGEGVHAGYPPTAAAIDRLIHHATILEMTGPSHRNEEAKKRAKKPAVEVSDDN